MENKTGIILTEKAAKEVIAIMQQEEFDAKTRYLRVGVRGGGCAGFSYLLDITELKKESDEQFDHHGVMVICDPKSLLYLNGTTIDFDDTIQGRGFLFNNPSSTGSCGCGSSFSV